MKNKKLLQVKSWMKTTTSAEQNQTQLITSVMPMVGLHDRFLVFSVDREEGDLTLFAALSILREMRNGSVATLF